ncbi:MAG TPA: glycosyltransferase family 4 protein [Drouetiella sp.]
MHVAMVLRQFSPFGGLELYAFEVVKGLLSRGIRVTVICEKDDTNFQHENLAVVKFAGPPSSSNKADKIKHYYQVSNEAVAENGPFDLVHSQHFPLNCADVVTFHNHTIHRLGEVGQGWEHILNQFKTNFTEAYKLREIHDKELCHQARCLIFPAQVCVEDFDRQYGIKDKRIAIAHPGARALSTSSGVADLQNQTFNFLFVGKGFRKKGLDTLLKASKLLASKNKNFKLYIAGLRLKPFDKLRLSSMGLTNHVEYLGFQKDMEAVFRRASAIILPSRIEPFGMAPIEGMLRGLVPIVSKVCGVAEVLHDEVDALILKNHLDADELAQLMDRLITDPKLVQRLSQEALKTSRTLTWDATVESTIAAYNATFTASSLTK